jgi:hypothetical protein
MKDLFFWQQLHGARAAACTQFIARRENGGCSRRTCKLVGDKSGCCASCVDYDNTSSRIHPVSRDVYARVVSWFMSERNCSSEDEKTNSAERQAKATLTSLARRRDLEAVALTTAPPTTSFAIAIT